MYLWGINDLANMMSLGMKALDVWLGRKVCQHLVPLIANNKDKASWQQMKRDEIERKE